MATRKQIAANRRNSRKSTGPRTDAGKNRSRLNATRHGLTGQVTIMTNEDFAAREAFSRLMIQSFQPKTPYETQLAQAIAICHWRINRAAVLEENILTLGTAQENLTAGLNFDNPQVASAFNQAVAFLDDASAFDRLSLYTNRLTGQAARHLKELRQVQATRKAQEELAMQEAATLYKFFELKCLAFDPAANGFVLSLPEIRAQVHREALRQSAQTALNSGQHPEPVWDSGLRAA